MNTEIDRIILDDQELYCPTKNQWNIIFTSGKINNQALPVIDLIKSKVERNFKYSELKSCLIINNQHVMFIELLKIDSELVRVFVESVICENCKNRATVSATPGVSDLYIGLENKDESMERGYSFKNLKCAHCDSVYERRYTIWQKYD